MRRTTAVDRDGALDNQVVAHEWGHFISNRLIGDASGLNTQMAGGLGEGWGDFHALLMTVKPQDSGYITNRLFQGAYPVGGYAVSDYYFAIRRVPYSVNFNLNPLTFKHISNGVPLPGGVPILFGQDGSDNAEVHNTGEIWATMLWECWASLLRDSIGSNPRLTFDEARDRMKDYIVAGYKMTPNSPTLLEARDAVLAAAYANDKLDFQLFWEAFARRGAGINAVAPDRFSTTNSPGLVESFEVGGALDLISTVLDDSVVSCDKDGALDNGEVGRLRITIRNIGPRSLSSTNSSVSATNPNVVFPNGNQVAFAATRPFETATAYINVSLTKVSGIQKLDFKISISDPGLTPNVPVVGTLVARGNYNTVTGSTTDDVEPPVSAWTPTVALGEGPFERLIETTSPLNHLWHGPSLGQVSDRALVSPQLKVGPGTFSLSFDHRYSFEFDGSTYFDGGVIELLANGSATWTDIGVGYTQTIATGGGNPLEGRRAYAGASPGYPAKVKQTINLGTTYANQTIRIRFRIGEDVVVGAAGWDLDNFAFNGLTNAPFTKLEADPGCVVRPMLSSQFLGNSQ
jgi:hypothetical protein